MFSTLHRDLIITILSYSIPDIHCTLDPEHLLSWNISNHPNAVSYLLSTQEHIDYGLFSRNPSDEAVDYLLKNPGYIYYSQFSRNPNEKAVDFMLANPDRICIWNMSFNTNPRAIHYLITYMKRNPDLYISEKNVLSTVPCKESILYLIQFPNDINYISFCTNPHDLAVEFLLTNKKRILWSECNKNTNNIMVSYLINNPIYIMNTFSSNTNTKAVEYLIQHPDQIDWILFSSNTNDQAVRFLLQHEHHIHWSVFTLNPNDIAVDYLLQHEDLIDNYLVKGNSNKKILYYIMKHHDRNPNFKWKDLYYHPFLFTKEYNKVKIQDWIHKAFT